MKTEFRAWKTNFYYGKTNFIYKKWISGGKINLMSELPIPDMGISLRVYLLIIDLN